MKPVRKYRNKVVTVDGITFDSKVEANKWFELKLLERAGEISDLRRQVTFPIVVNGQKICKYIADFVYEKDGHTVVVDVKSAYTAKLREFVLKKKLLKAVYGVDITITQ
jgi:hypothetical protein